MNYCDVNCEESHADDAFDDGYAKTAPVGSYPGGASWVGALDLAGNVVEWVADWLGRYPQEPLTDPTGDESGDEKVGRGGSWFYHRVGMQGASRAKLSPTRSYDYIGFRCVVP